MKAVFLMLVVGVAVIPAAFGLKCYNCLGDNLVSGRNGPLGRSEDEKSCKGFKKEEAATPNCADGGVCYTVVDYGGSGCISKTTPNLPAVGSCGDVPDRSTGKTVKVCVCNTDLCNFDQKGGKSTGGNGNKATSILGPSSGLWIFLGVFYLVCQLFFFGDGSLALF